MSGGGMRIISYIIFIILEVLIDAFMADHEFMVTRPESRIVPFDFDTKLLCEMNIEPDKFLWKFYPLNSRDAFNPKAVINLSSTNFVNIPVDKNPAKKKQSDLTIQVNTTNIAGDYQCLAYYGASVVASIPWRITIMRLGEFPKQQDADVTILAGNTVNWRCELPDSNPEAYIDYYRNDQYFPSNFSSSTKSLILPNVNVERSGKYKCRATSTGQFKESMVRLNLKVVQNAPQQAPSFIITPKSTYTVRKGDTVFLECSAVGNPIPQVVWLKKNVALPSHRVDMIKGGLVIKNIMSTDDGVYVCNHTNILGTLSHQITLVYNEEPSIECILNTTDVKQGENLDLDCIVGGTPEPQITWFLNGYSVINDSAVEAIGNRIYFRPVEKRHAGNLQIFARNIVKTIYNTISLKVIPLSTSIDVTIQPTDTTNHRHHDNGKSNNNNHNNAHRKHTKMIPPTKPIISRLSDQSVMVRWSVTTKKSLPIQFFKVQFRELGPISDNDHHGRSKGSRWRTTDDDIVPHINSYEVKNLKADHIYKFRIAAVYSNNDNKLSPNSDKFNLRRLDFDKRNPLPVPLITQTETVNSTAVKIYWKYIPQPNITVDGFYINYVSASSAADYIKATVDGEHASSYVLAHLQPDTFYDIKLQSFTSKSASHFSSIMKAKTLAVSSTPSPAKSNEAKTPPAANVEAGGISKLYVFIAVGVIVGAVGISSIVGLLLYCRKWKEKKNSGGSRSDRNKATVDDHHIQVDANEYVVSPKSLPRANGCAPSSRITITANPLADADNKKFLARIFSRIRT